MFFYYYFANNIKFLLKSYFYSKPSKDIMTGYAKRIDFLKGVISAMKLSNPVERVVAAQLISKNSASMNNSNTNITTQIHQKTIAKYNKELRADLFHTDKSNFLLYYFT